LFVIKRKHHGAFPIELMPSYREGSLVPPSGRSTTSPVWCWNHHEPKENEMDARPRTKAAKKHRIRIKEQRRLKKTQSKVMPMLSRPRKLKVNKRARAAG